MSMTSGKTEKGRTVNMQSQTHKAHIAANVSHNNCPECRADCERQFVGSRPFRYDHVTEYLRYVRPRLVALRTGRNGGASIDAQWWYRDFIAALNRRISSHVATAGRKHSHGYLERLRMANYKGNHSDAGYFREFARKGASTL